MPENINPETGEIRRIKAAYEPHQRQQLAFNQPSRAHQSFKDECDINNVMRKYERTGLLEHVNRHQGDYGDFIGFDDYQTSMQQVLEAENAFMTLPSKIRAQFENDAAAFLRFAQNPENLDQMIEMGLARPKEPAQPIEGSGEATSPEGGEGA